MKVFELATVDLTLYKFVLPLMKELNKNGFDVICGARDHGYLDKIFIEGFKTYDIAFCRSLNPFALTKSFFQLVKILKQEQVDILHVHTPIASIVGRLATFFSKVKVKVYTVHGFIFQPQLFFYVEKFMAKFFTDFIFTVNQEDYDTAISNNFLSSDKIMNIHSVGIDIHRFNPEKVDASATESLRQALNFMKDDTIIGFVGRIVQSKGVLDLVNAYMEVRKIKKCKLLLIGPWDFNERAKDSIISELQHLIKDNHLEDEILLTGFREDIPELLSLIDIFVLPSYREGMPVSLLEAMSMEKAVIGTNIRGVREEITKDYGLLYEPKEINSLIKCLVFCLNNTEETKAIGKRARQRVMKEFCLDQVLNRQMNVFTHFKKILMHTEDE